MELRVGVPEVLPLDRSANGLDDWMGDVEINAPTSCRLELEDGTVVIRATSLILDPLVEMFFWIEIEHSLPRGFAMHWGNHSSVSDDPTAIDWQSSDEANPVLDQNSVPLGWVHTDLAGLNLPRAIRAYYFVHLAHSYVVEASPSKIATVVAEDFYVQIDVLVIPSKAHSTVKNK